MSSGESIPSGKRRKDITGQVFGYLTAFEPTDQKYHTSVIWKCRCVCGKECEVPISRLTQGKTKSCGCQSKPRTRAKDLTGQTFGRLTALYPTEKRYFQSVVWHCRCSCGTEKDIPASRLKDGTTRSCGCIRKKEEHL